MFEKEKEKLKGKGVNTKLMKVEALVIYDQEGYVTGVKYPDKSKYLGKPVKN